MVSSKMVLFCFTIHMNIKAKVVPVLKHYTMKTCAWMEVKLHPFLNLALDAGSSQLILWPLQGLLTNGWGAPWPVPYLQSGESRQVIPLSCESVSLTVRLSTAQTGLLAPWKAFLSYHSMSYYRHTLCYLPQILEECMVCRQSLKAESLY
jgi:hypothetical protein